MHIRRAANGNNEKYIKRRRIIVSTKDILKKSFLESITAADITLPEIGLVLAVTTVIALYIFFV